MQKGIATALAFLVAPGPSVTFWLDHPAGGVSGSPFFTDQTFAAVLARAGVDGALKAGLWLALSVGLVLLAAPVIRRAPAPLALMATAGVALLVSPTSWSHHWVWVAPALLVAAASAARSRSPGWLVATVLTAAVFVVAPHQLDLPHEGVAWTLGQQVLGDTYVWFTVALFVALWWRWGRGQARNPGVPVDASR